MKIARDFTYSALWMAYGAMLMVVGFWRRSAFVRWQALVLIAFTIGKVFLYDVSELDRGYRIVSFIVLGALLLAISFVYQRDWLRLSGTEQFWREFERKPGRKSGEPMKSLFCALALIVALGTPLTPEPSISYFTNVRDIRISQPGAQNYFVVDEEIWNRARPDLADLRIYDGESQVQYALSEQRGRTSSQEEAAAKILNLGSVGGRTEFDLDAWDGQIGEYDRIRLNLDAKDFVVTASVAGSNELGAKMATQLPPATLYDFTREELGSNPVLKLPPSSFRYLHVKLSAGNLRPHRSRAHRFTTCRKRKPSGPGWDLAGRPREWRERL